MNIFACDDYRIFLVNFLQNAPKKGRGQKSKLAEYLGVNASFITHVLNGEKDFSLEQAKKVSEFFLLKKIEEDYFLTLVQVAKAGTIELKDYFQNKKIAIRKNSMKISTRLEKKKGLTDLERSIFYSGRIYSSVHLYTSLQDGKSLEEIMKRFSLSQKRANEIIHFLINAGLVKKNKNLFVMSQTSTFIEKGSPFSLNHHSNWRIHSINKIEKLKEEELIYTGNYSLSKKDFLIIREELMKKIQEVVNVVKASNAEELANLNIDFYWQ